MSVSAPAYRGDPALPVLLGKAVRSPDCVSTRDGGPVLALSIHLEHKKGSLYSPQHDWNTHPDAWVFRYRKSGLANTFTYTCALKQSTLQAYVHIEEDGNAENVAFMGLILNKYIQDPELLKQHTWEGVLSHEEDLEAYFHEYLVTPVLSRAVQSSDGRQNSGTDNRSLLLKAGGGLVAAGAMLLLAQRARR